MSKKILSIILALILLICFFLPYLTIGSTSTSGFNIVFGKDGLEGISSSGRYLFVSLLIPIGAVLLLIGAVINDSFTSSGFVYWMPLAGIIYILVSLYLGATGNNSEYIAIGEYVGIFSYGLWITLIAAIILPFSRRA
jgi:hypothetical protein